VSASTHAAGSAGTSRRAALGLFGGLVGGAVAGGGATACAVRVGDAEPAVAAGAPVPFHGDHQAGIATAVQDRLHMAAFDLRTTGDSAADRAALVRLLRRWTAAAERMTRGLETVEGGAVPAVADAPPEDTGEALALPPARLTLTLGLGGSLFEHEGRDRLGLRSHRPAALADLPRFKGDDLDAGRGGGDLVVQACADDPQVAVHAVRNLARIATGTAAVRWSQLGFGRTSSTTPAAQTPRNLFGFKDGTANIAGDDAAALAQHVWVGAGDDPAAGWMAGGSYLVARRIAMRIESWDRTSLREQEDVTGRHKLSGAPLGATAEHDDVRVGALPATSHVALAHPDSNGGHRILRRGYSYVDGSDGLGHLDAGLFFLAFCRDPRTQYVPLQTRLARSDAMAEYLTHTASGLYAVPPGLGPGEYWAQPLLEA
jgi:deferrochelatase/peroxidase EfeB